MTRGQRDANERINDPDAAERGYQARNTLESLKALRRRDGRRARPAQGDASTSAKASTTTSTIRSTTATRRRSWIRRATPSPRRPAPTSPSTASTCAASAPASTMPSRSQSFPTIRRSGSTRARCRTKCASGRTACACSPTRPAASPHVNTNDINGAFRRVVDENSSYYVLGYYPANDRRDGRFRKIEVAWSTSPGSRVTRAARLRGAARPRRRRPSWPARTTRRPSCARR